MDYLYDEDSWKRGAGWRSSTEKESRPAPGRGITVMGLAAAALIVLALVGLPGGSSAPGPHAATAGGGGYVPPGSGSQGFADRLRLHIGSSGSATLRSDFHSSMSDWVGSASAASDWAEADGFVRPGRLRLWRPSAGLSNYDMEFLGQVERKGMSWAFRAPDLRNYYAASLRLAHGPDFPNAGLVRSVVLDGREADRIEMPLPLSLERGVDYRIHVSVRGDRFLTSVNGQLVSSWTDSRIGTGGVGFFSDAGESAAIRWVTVSERDSLLGRILSHFSLLLAPGACGSTD
jgi:hypothetical protein